MLDLQAQYDPMREAIEAAIKDVCDRQYFILGPNVLELERRVAEYSRTEFGIGVSSGTDALLLALMALGIGPGDAVITSPFTFFATGGVIARVGAMPLFRDIRADTYNLDPESVKSYLTERCRRQGDRLVDVDTGAIIKAIMPVHLFGQLAEMQAIRELALEFGLRLIEDAAQAIGAEDDDGQRAGSIGDIGCFSFFPSKNLGAFGDGGMCVTNDAELAEKMRILRVHGGKPKYYHALIGGNFRLDAIQAAVLLVKLDHLDDWSAKRQGNAELYTALFSKFELPVCTPFIRSGVRHVFNQYTLNVERRDELHQFLNGKGVGSAIYYPIPLHLQQCFGQLGYKVGDLPVSEAAAQSVLSIPIYPELTPEQQEYVVSMIASFYS